MERPGILSRETGHHVHADGDLGNVLENPVDKSGKIRLYLAIESRQTLDAESLFYDLNFAFIYADKIERMAIVGSRLGEETCAALFGLFARITTEFFDRSEAAAAMGWLQK